jgi:hypothetical protein
LRQRLASLMDRLGLLRHPTKGFWTPAQVGHHMGIDINTASCYFYAPDSKLAKIIQQARQLIGRATRNARWIPFKDLQSLVEHAMHYTISWKFFLPDFSSESLTTPSTRNGEASHG